MCKFLHKGWPYIFVMDSITPLAVITSVFAFLFFKNLQVHYNKLINIVAASTFGVLLIHDNSRIMQDWLWKHSLKPVEFFSRNIYLHAFLCVIGVYVFCTLIDFVRIRLLEKPFFLWFDKKTGIEKNG